MPTYQYACTECGERLEAVQKFSDAPLTVCDACGGKLRKVFSAVGIVFKGSGFYRTDSRNGSSASAPAKPKETSGATAGSDSGSSNGNGSGNGNGSSSGTGDSKPAEKVATASAASEKVA